MIQGKIAEQKGEIPAFKLIRERGGGRPSAGMTWLLRVRIFLMAVSLGVVIWTIYKLK